MNRLLQYSKQSMGSPRFVLGRAHDATGPGKRGATCNSFDFVNTCYVVQVHLVKNSFTYDYVYGDGASAPNRLYSQCVSPLVDSLFMGYNATVFAYGKLRGALMQQDWL